jgi:hypothetical protein
MQMISRSDVFLRPSLGILEGKELRALLLKAVEAHGTRRAAADSLGWALSGVERLLDAEVMADLPGPIVLSLSLEDIKGLSLLRVRKMIWRAVVTAVRHLGSNYDIALVLDIKEWDVRRNVD